MMFEAFRQQPPTAPPAPFQSPGLGVRSGFGAAYELKFQLTGPEADAIEAWARAKLTPDPHGNDGVYQIVSIYHDTPRLDVYHRGIGFRRNKFRMRRYNNGTFLFLERKTRRGDRVRKKRAVVSLNDLQLLAGRNVPESWEGSWFHRRLQLCELQPTCRVSYERTAFFGSAADGPIRLTLDRSLVGAPVRDWDVSPVDDGVSLLPDGVLLEMKFHAHLPPLFRELLPQLPCQSARVSKYRRCIEFCDLAETAAEPCPAPVADLLRVIWPGAGDETLPRAVEGV
ncbi:MAG: polyphosphate polymerase domain-containing protein [Gemmataceae bacterium]|nr:polyphosphate polymerase domain-containing protein [Gemmataceae bacterium]